MILISGLGGGCYIYLTAEPTPVSSSEYDRFTSKKYVRELERFGGKFAVVTAELSQWFAGLWHGKSLAITVGILSLLLALLLWFISPFLQSRTSLCPPDTPGDADPACKKCQSAKRGDGAQPSYAAYAQQVKTAGKKKRADDKQPSSGSNQ